jgi:hypothetical protein
MDCFGGWLGRFLNKKITPLWDLEMRRETTNGFRKFMTDYSHVLTEELFFFFKRSSVILLYDGFYV